MPTGTALNAWKACMILCAVAGASVFQPVLRGCEIEYFIWGIHSQTADPLFRFLRHGKTGYIDATGRIVIRPALPADKTSFNEFHEGLLGVRQDPGYGYVDRSGAIVVHANVWLAGDFSEGLAPAPIFQLGRPPKWGFIDHTGHFAIPPEYSAVDAFSEGLASVTVSDTGTSGYYRPPWKVRHSPASELRLPLS